LISPEAWADHRVGTVARRHSTAGRHRPGEVDVCVPFGQHGGQCGQPDLITTPAWSVVESVNGEVSSETWSGKPWSETGAAVVPAVG
jgi:hypothetical protein